MDGKKYKIELKAIETNISCISGGVRVNHNNSPYFWLLRLFRSRFVLLVSNPLLSSLIPMGETFRYRIN
jgi:hypothetical protein